MSDAGAFRIDRDGVWRHEGQEVTHPGVLANLYANLQVGADGHYLQVGPARIPVVVDDAPFLVTRVELPRAADGAVERVGLWLSDGTQEALRPETLWLGARNAPYCRVKSDRFTARLSVAAWLQLADLVDATAAEPILRLGGRRVRLTRRP